MRKGGVRIAYSRHPKSKGYYLQYPPLERPSTAPYERANWTLIRAMRQLSIPEKNIRSFAAAAFALRQKELILAEEHPDWEPSEVTVEARQQVFGVEKDFLDLP